MKTLSDAPMDIVAFSETLKRVFPPATILDNPIEGTSEVLAVGEERIRYRRKQSSRSLPTALLYQIVCRYNRLTVTTSELKRQWPQVFDSKHGGHSCNATFAFTCIVHLGWAAKIHGRGVRNNPFLIDIRLPAAIGNTTP